MRGLGLLRISSRFFPRKWLFVPLVLAMLSSCKEDPAREEPVFPDMDKSMDVSRNIRKLDSMERLEGFNPEFYYFRGMLHMKAGTLEAAARDLEKALRLANKPRYHYELAKVYLKQEQYRQSWFHSWVPEYEVLQHPLLFYIRARSLLLMGYPEEGLEPVNSLLDEVPEFSKGRHLKALLLHDAGQYQQSIRLAGKVLEDKPEFMPALELMVTGYIHTGKRDSAMVFIRKGLKQDSTNKYLYYRKGLLHQEYRQWGPALRAFREMYRVDSMDYRANFHLGKFAYQTGRYRDAIKYLSGAVTTEQDSLEPRRMLAGSYERTGKYSEALDEYKKLARMDSTNAYYQRKVRWLTRRTTSVINSGSPASPGNGTQPDEGNAAKEDRTEQQETKNQEKEQPDKDSSGKSTEDTTQDQNTNDSL